MKKTSTFGSYLFGFIFFLAGAGFFYVFVGKTLVSAWQMQSWHSTTAQLIDARITSYQKRNDNGGYTTMYKVAAKYSYQVANQRYTGDRPTISSMSSSERKEHKKLLDRIKGEQRNNNGITIWYDPDEPSQSVYDRTLNIQMILMMTAFTSIFMLVGGGIIIYVFTTRHDDKQLPTALPDKPWTSRKEWASPEIYSKAKSSVKLAWFLVALASCFFGAFSLALFGKHPIATGISLLLAVIPILVIKRAIRIQREWKRFQTVPLLLHPYPGVIGGNVGGELVVPVTLQPGDIYTVKLECIKHWVTRRNNKTQSQQAAVWSNEQEVVPNTHIDGTLINFLFKVPAGSPASSKPDDLYHEWILSVVGNIEGVDFNREYELPVFETEDSQSIAEELEENPLSLSQQQEINERLSVSKMGDSISLETPGSKAGIPFAAIGGLFSIIGIAIAIFDELFFGIVFALIGSLFFFLGLWIWGRNCKIEISPNKFEMEVFWFGFSINQHMLTAIDVQSIESYASSSSHSTGGKLEEKYGLRLITYRNKKLDLGGEFKSKKNAEHMKMEIESILNIFN